MECTADGPGIWIVFAVPLIAWATVQITHRLRKRQRKDEALFPFDRYPQGSKMALGIKLYLEVGGDRKAFLSRAHEIPLSYAGAMTYLPKIIAEVNPMPPLYNKLNLPL